MLGKRLSRHGLSIFRGMETVLCQHVGIGLCAGTVGGFHR